MVKKRIPKKKREVGDSRCLLCGKIMYGQEVETCPKCGGMCRVMLPDELRLSGRHSATEHSVLY
jgi:hypothetical protein